MEEQAMSNIRTRQDYLDAPIDDDGYVDFRKHIPISEAPAMTKTKKFDLTDNDLREIGQHVQNMSIGERVKYLTGRFGDDDAPDVNCAVINVMDRFTTTENPKAVSGRQKIEYANTPALPALYQAAVHDLGAGKYGSYNWRDRPIKVMDYISAIRRHLALLESGDWDDEESGLPHLAHVMATAAIVIDARAAHKLIDDRQMTPQLPDEMKRIAELKKGWPRAA